MHQTIGSGNRNGKKQGGNIPKGFIQGGRASQEYLLKKGLVESGGVDPKNAPAYREIMKAFPDFNYEVVACTGKNGDIRRAVKFKGYPRFIGDHPSLATLLKEALRGPDEPPLFRPDNFSPIAEKRARTLHEYVGQEYGDIFMQALLDLPAILPPKKVIHSVGRWLKRAIEKKTATIFAGVCPPYAFQENDGIRQYTFNGLHEGIGIVAQNVLAGIISIHDVLKSFEVDAHFVVAMADFEGDSENTLQRIKMERKEFMNHLIRSQDVLRDSVPVGINISTPLATELFGRHAWNRTVFLAKNAVEKRKFGAFTMTESDFKAICGARESLIKRWYGDCCDVDAQVLAQAPEYMAVATLAEQCLDNPLIIGGDSVAMAGFMQGLTSVSRPVIYLRTKHY